MSHEPSLKPLRALLVQAMARRETRERAERLATELEKLAISAGIEPLGIRFYSLPRAHSGTFLGTGNLESLATDIIEQEANLVVFNHSLTPTQQRNLEKALAAKVSDRTGLILEIFSARARTREGRLQVELAALLYQQSRLVRSWTHLERQKGGVGLRGGPGETQIEVDRRMIRDRIQKLEKSLETVKRTRTLQRRARQDVPFFSVALVGYTNAGKSTLFNRLTGAHVIAEDQLFATLDPTLRKIELPNGDRIILSDTVGFIRDLPHQLVAAFRATLEETLEADLLLHVVDLSDPEWEEQEASVLETLRELTVENKPMLTLYNKIDLLPPEAGRIARVRERTNTLILSAVSNTGVADLLDALGSASRKTAQTVHLILPAVEGALLARLCQEGHVQERLDVDDKIHLTVSLSSIARGRLDPLIRDYLVEKSE
ncbi:MAG: GTPase HflX [Magnetococcus sp. YQC-5]